MAQTSPQETRVNELTKEQLDSALKESRELVAELKKEKAEIAKEKKELEEKRQELENKIDGFSKNGEKSFASSLPKIRNVREDRIKKIKAILESEEKVKMVIPLEGSEKKGTAFKIVNINGYRQKYPKGQFIELPKSVAALIQSSQVAGDEASQIDSSEGKKEIDLEKNQEARSTLV